MAASTYRLARLIQSAGKGWAFLLLAAAILIVQPGAAAQEQKPSISIRSDTLKTASLPPPGYALRIKAELLQTRDVLTGLRAMVNIDGEAIEVPVLGGRINEQSRPEYYIEISAPKRSLSWEFALFQEDGSVIRSGRFNVQRSCIAETKLLDLEEAWEVPGDELVGVCINRSERLERELNAYDQAISMAKRLKSEMGINE